MRKEYLVIWRILVEKLSPCIDVGTPHGCSPLFCLSYWDSCCSYDQITCLHLFSSTVWCPLRYQRKIWCSFVFTPICFVGRSWFFVYVICIYKRVLVYNMMFVSLNRNTKSVTSRTETANHSGAVSSHRYLAWDGDV